MNRNSTSYTFIFAAVMVIIVAILLASAAIGLKPAQEKNVRRNKMQDILKSVNIIVTPKEAEESYSKYIQEEIVLDYNGEVVEGVNAFELDLAKELKKDETGQQFPLFKANVEGTEYYIVPMRGKGLWGPIWGYIALEGGQTISKVYGASFDHKGETPGLGAEINTSTFQQQFAGKAIFDEDGTFKPIRVIKGTADPSDPHGVSGISGGTITSNGVSEMIARTLARYENYLKGISSPVSEDIIEEDASYDDAIEENYNDSLAINE